LHRVCWSPEPIRAANTAATKAHFALQHVSCDIAAGDMVAVVGPNGAGKTSLLRCMLGLRDVASGTIELANQPLNSWTIQQRAGLMSYVPQHTHSDFALRVVDLVQMGRLPSANLSIEPAIDTPATETQATDIPATSE